MPNVHGIEFGANQAELVKEVIRELLKDGDCAVFAVPHMKPHGELRMASTPPDPGLRRQQGVFLRILPGINEATVVRPTNATEGDAITKLTKFSRPELVTTIRLWREQVTSGSADDRNDAISKSLVNN